MALGGGASRGLTHIPFIEAMDELGLKPSTIAGTSIGALIGSGWANGMSGELREHAISVLGTMRIIAGRLWGAQIRNLGGLLQNELSMRLDATRVVDAFLPTPFPNDFRELKVPFYVVATDFQSWHQAVFNAGPLRLAIAGSIAIPTLFKPVRFANHPLVDGGVGDPLPVDQAMIRHPSLPSTSTAIRPEALGRTDFKALDTWFGSAQIAIHLPTAHAMAAYPPDVYVRPTYVRSSVSLEFWRVKEILAQADRKDNFKRHLTHKIKTVHHAYTAKRRAPATRPGFAKERFQQLRWNGARRHRRRFQG